MASASGPQVVILGAGLTGLATALHLRDCSVALVEREQRVGGKARSERRGGYTFDVTGHWLHLRDDRVRALVGRLFSPGDLVEIERKTGVYTHGVMLPYPFQANLHGLPLPIVHECLVGFFEAQLRSARGDAPEPRTFEEYAVARFGAGIARHFFVPYNQKLWGMHPDRLTAAWVSRYIPIPDPAQVIGGAIGLRQEGLGYNARFLYPRRGGIDALPEAMCRALPSGTDLRLSTAVTSVHPFARRVELSDGSALTYDRLVSSLPLPELVARMVGVPDAVREAAAKLRSVRWRYLNVATATRPPIEEHWVYVPDPDIPFFRVGVFSNAVPSMAPPGAGALYVELTDREHDPDLGAVYDALARMGAITSPDDVVFADVRDVEHAYVVFDEHHEAATKTIFSWLREVGVHSCGRYGSWIYNSMEDSILQGMEAARWCMR